MLNQPNVSDNVPAEIVKTDAKTDARALGKEEAVDVVHGVHFALVPLSFSAIHSFSQIMHLLFSFGFFSRRHVLTVGEPSTG